VRRVGEETFRLAKQYVDEILLVTTDQICAAIQDIFEDTRSIAEPAGALAVAGIKKFVAREACTGRTLVAINGGANMNFDRLRYVAERSDVGAQREALMAVELSEAPGSFLRLCELLANRSVTEFNYRYSDVKTAQVFVGLSIAPGLAMRTALIQSLRDAGFAVRDMTDDETAKLHVRYMVGGHPGNLEHERLYRFEFPERPGTLLNFLRAIGTQWNVSLFHYRNHGSEHGRVLAGIQVPPDTVTDFLLHINQLQYPFTEETDNPAYRLFLSR
jgi:threonine dehydratase